MVVNKTCNHFLENVKPEERYYDGLRYGGIGPTGYNMNGVEDKDYFEVLADQGVALLRLGRIAHQQKRCLSVVIRYDRSPSAPPDTT